jgi:hypothetical protein
MIMVLDVYDLIKKVRKHQKIKARLAASGAGPHPSDIPQLSYEVINHSKCER